VAPRSSAGLDACLRGRDGQLVGLDYRGIESIHGFRHLEQAGGVCVLAHIDLEEAYAPAAALRARTAQTAVFFGLVAIALSIGLSRLLSGPIERLVRRVRAFEAGDFDSPVPAEGPKELSGFAQAFTEMARSIKASRAALESAHARAAFLAEASKRLAASLDYEATLAQVAELAVPYLADACIVYIRDAHGPVRRLKVVHRDPAKRVLLDELQQHAVADWPAHPVVRVMDEQRPLLLSEVPQALVDQLAADAPHRRLIEQVGIRSAMAVPLMAAGKAQGAIGFAITESDRRYIQEDLAVADELALRAGQAIENARLYSSVRQEMGERKRLEERYRLLVESVKDYAIFAIDPDGRIVNWNTGAQRIAGYRPDEVIGKPYACFYTDEDVHRGAPERALTLAAAEGRHESEGWRVRKDGSRFWANAVLTRVTDETGRVLGFGQIIRDLTERRRAEEELVKAAKLESVVLLASGVAHDFNNILTAIMGNLALAKLTLAPDEELHERLSEAENATLRAKDLTQQLQTLSRAGAPGRPRPLRLGPFLRSVVGFALRGTNVQPRFDLPEDLWAVQADEGQLSQVINNLVINASQAMPQGGAVEIAAAPLRVDGSSTELPVAPGNYVRVRVADHGIGIPKENLARIFDPFFTTKPKGSGLGLTTSYWIVRKHGGHIQVASEPGVGTTFDIFLPAAQREEGEPLPSGEAVQASGGRILFMDDDQAIRTFISQMLKRLGYEVATTGDGAEAIDCYVRARRRGQPFDAVVLDLTVPGAMGGREAVAKLREIDPEVKAIVSSGYTTDEVLADYRRFGFVAMVAKPYRMEDLQRVLAAVVRQGSSV
jgi:PAS domain S-box-containing protein